MKLQKGYVKTIYFEDMTFKVSRDVYEPSEDTFLLARNLSVNVGDVVLDMGTGCGIIAITAIKRGAKKVIAIDINPHATKCTKINGEVNGVSDRLDIICGDLFRPIRTVPSFDLIVFNAPYLPSEGVGSDWIDLAWSGGKGGRDIIDRFISEAPKYLKRGGYILMVQSSLSNPAETLRRLRDMNLEAKIIAEEKVFFERIILIEARKNLS